MNSLNNLEKNHIWINLKNPSEEELIEVSKRAEVPVETLKHALDSEETSHLDIDDESIMIILDIPIGSINDNTLIFDTYPLGIIYTDDYVITICLKDTKIISDLYENGKAFNGVQLVLDIIMNIYKYYNIYLKEVNNKYVYLERYLSRKMKNEQILQLYSLKKSIVYFSISLKSNELTLRKMLNVDMFKNEKIINEVLREHRQTTEMVKTYDSIISNTINFFSYIISNNSNITMKKLAEITILVTMPTIVASIFGMNIILPISKTDPKGLIKVAGILIIAMFITIMGLYKKNKN